MERDERLRETFMRQARDYDDLQYEMAGISRGKINRFVSEERFSGRVSENRRAERAEALTRLQLLMASDPAYAALYVQVMDALSEAEALTQAAIEAAEVALHEAQKAHEALLSQAAQLEDGTRVFRDAEGRIWSENGELITGEDAESIVWPNDAPSHEEYRRSKETVDHARGDLDSLLLYQTDVLGRARDRLNDPENPPSQDELEEIKREIEDGVRPLMKGAVREDRPELERADYSVSPARAIVPEV
ncbi:MAG: hypothetical protein AAF367_19470 [Pseudomonadota bacterium]